MTKQVLKVDPVTDEVTTVEFDEMAQKMVITSEANVGPQIDDNKREQNESHREIPGLGHKIAHIPPTVGLYWLHRYGIDVWSGDPDQRLAVLRLLNSPDWQFLRTNHADLGTRERTHFHRK